MRYVNTSITYHYIKQHYMRKFSILAFMMAIMSLSSCQVIGDIFKAGVYVGIIVVILVVAIIIWIIRKISG